MCPSLPSALPSSQGQHQVTLQHSYVMFDILGTADKASFIFMLPFTKPTLGVFAAIPMFVELL